MTVTPRAELIADRSCITGENPLWHPDEHRLYWTDIPAGRLFFYEPSSGRIETCYADRPVGGFTIQSDGDLLLFRDKGNVVTFRDGKLKRTVIDAIPELAETRFNDVIADPSGRVFAGTMSFGGELNGKLYVIDTQGHYRVVSDGNGTPNGMGFSPDASTMYFTDSKLRRVYAFDYNASDGSLGERRVVHEVAASDVPTLGRQDGMTVDASGHIWSARIDAGVVTEFDADFNVLRHLHVPVAKVTCVTFGGSDYRDLYVTTAGGDQKVSYGSSAGALFRLSGVGQGVAEHRSRILE